MKHEKIKHAIKSNQMTLLGIGLCILFWIIESAIHIFVFHKGGFIRQLLTSDPHEIWMRAIVFGILIVFSIYAQLTINKRRRAEEALQKLSNTLEKRVEERTDDLKKTNEQLQLEIKERKSVEGELRKSEERYKGIIENTKDGVAVYKAINDGEDFVFVDLNKAGEKISEVTREAVVGKSLTTLFPGIKDLGLFDVFQRVFMTGKPEYYPVSQYKDQRLSQWVDNSVYKLPSGEIVAVYSDETKRKDAEEVVTASENRYRVLTENVADGVCILQDRKLEFLNAAFADIFDYTIADLTGTDLLRLTHNNDKKRLKDLFSNLERGDNPVSNFQAVYVRKDGQEIWVESRYSSIQWQNKPAILATARDITKAKQREIANKKDRELLQKENLKLRTSIKDRYKFGNIIGKSHAMQEVYELILKAGASDVNVVILGESGTGKELVARAIHQASVRANRILVPVNCGAIPANLAETEFFGHRKGAFTGAHIDKNGYINTAGGGTLFLDEVAELDPNLQVKLLRAIETGEYVPVGDTRPRKSDLRIISATNRDLAKMVAKGLMREDFYYRISVIPITLPPLRKRKQDIPLLIEHFIKLHSNGKKALAIPGTIMDALIDYDWPGNVRELQSMIQRYLAMGNFDFFRNISLNNSFKQGIDCNPKDEVTDLRYSIEQYEKRSILTALHKYRWQRSETAVALGIDPKTLYSKIKKFGLHRDNRASIPELN